MSEELETRWTRAAADLLVGRKITAVHYMVRSDANEIGWEYRPIVLTLDNGVRLYPSSDEEGNGPGALFTTHQTIHTIPTI
jgi:hypothetical protein